MNESHPHENPWVDRIASYLRDHRHSSDTAEGVARWWLNAPVTDWAHVRRALESMVSDGRLERHVTADGREHYRLPAGTGDTSLP
jgi:hypothetical protein